MKAAAFAYHDPASLAELLPLLGKLENARMLAGGQSLVPMLNMRYVIPDHVIDLNRLGELAYVRETAGGLQIGAMTRQRDLERHPLVQRKAPILIEALRHVGHVQTRSRGTIGGSLCHLDPAAELPGIAALTDATLHVAGPRGRRDVAMTRWTRMYMTPDLEADEMLTGLTLPVWTEPHGYAFIEYARRHGDYAIVAAACLLALAGNGRIARAAIALMGVDVRPVRLAAAEAALVGRLPGPDAFKTAADLARAVEISADSHVTKDYRQRLAATLTQRALTLAARRAQGGTHA